MVNLIKSNFIYKKLRNQYSLWIDSFRHLFFLKIVPHFPSHSLRLTIFRMSGAKLGKTVAIHSGTEIWNPKGLEIKEGVVVGFDCSLDARQGLIIHRNVCIASQVMIWTLHHDYNSPTFSTTGALVEIGEYSWLCSRCIILPGVRIAEGTVVASGAVVTKNTEPYSIVGGVPAKKIGKREKNKFNYIPSNHKLHII